LAYIPKSTQNHNTQKPATRKPGGKRKTATAPLPRKKLNKLNHRWLAAQTMGRGVYRGEESLRPLCLSAVQKPEPNRNDTVKNTVALERTEKWTENSRAKTPRNHNAGDTAIRAAQPLHSNGKQWRCDVVCWRAARDGGETEMNPG
jgi:hypothetical protein